MSAEAPSFDRRANLVGGAVVATAVLLLGFGSGIGSVVTRQQASTVTPGSATGEVVAAPAAAGVQVPGTVAAARVTAGTEATTGPAARAGTTATVSPAGRTAAAGAARATVPAGVCTGAFVGEAMAAPFVAHVGSAHLGESRGEQAADLLDADRYVKTHTVLAADMAAPAVDTATASLGGIDPFLAHVGRAHLEESPGQQAADLLDVDQYVKTHTVLVESMLAPATGAAMSAGC